MPLQMNNTRKIGSIPFVAGSRQTLDLQTGDILTDLFLFLTFTVTNGGSNAVGPFKQALARLMRRIEVNVNGRDTVVNIRGDSLAARAAYELGIAALGMDTSVTLTASAATTYKIVLPLQFTLPRGRRGDDTALDLRGISQATLAVTWGPVDCSDFYTSPNSAAISAVSLNVEGRYLPGGGVKPDGTMKEYMVRALDQIEREVTGTSSAFDVTVDNRTGLLIRSLFVEATAADIGLDTIINQLTLVSGQTTFRQTEGFMLKGENKGLFKIAPVAGDYFVFMPFLGQGSTMIVTNQLPAELRLSLDVSKQSGTNTVRVTRESVRPLNIA